MGQKQSKKSEGSIPPVDTATIQSIMDLKRAFEYKCDHCLNLIKDTRFACPECLHYDLCPACYKKHGHEHSMYEETVHPQDIFDIISQSPTSGQALLAMFKYYRHRLCLGYREPLKKNHDMLRMSTEQIIDQSSSERNVMVSSSTKNLRPLNPYKWITFGQLEERVMHLGFALRTLVEPRNFVGICTHVQLGWYIADYACQINSIIGPIIGPTTSLEGLVHIINSTKMSLIFCSKMLTPRFLAAAESCPTLKYIIQIEDMEPYQVKPKVKEATDKLREIAAKLLQQGNVQSGNGLVTKAHDSDECHQDVSTDKPKGKETKVDDSSNSNPGHPTSNKSSPSPINGQKRLWITQTDIDEWKATTASSGVPIVLNLSDMEALGHLVEPFEPVITPPNEIETLVYTSGSTGIPKGAIFTASAWKDQLVYKYAHSDIQATVTWSISDRKNDFRHLYFGGRIGIYNGEMSRIFEDLADIKPHQVNATPAFWNKIYAEFKSALTEATQGMEVGTDTYKNTKSKVLEDFNKLLGGKVESIITGGAPTSQEVLDFMHECWSCRVKESYGTTECGGIVAGGFFVPGLKWKLVSWEEYTVEDKPFPRGELCVQRSDMMSGYFGDAETTAEYIDSEGYYHTGDIVELNHAQNGAMVIDRKKNIFKLAQGEYVAPAKIEKAIVGLSPFVKQIFVYGDSFKSSLVAVIVPHQHVLLEHLVSSESIKARKVEVQSLSSKERCKLPESVEIMLTECARVGNSSNFRTFEIPAAVILSHEEFSKENGLHTISEKPARHALLKHFKTEIEALYQDLDSKHSETKSQVFKLLGKATENKNAATTSTVVISDESKDEEPATGLSLVQMGGDSLSAIRLRNMIKSNFNVTLPVDVLMNPNTDLAKIATYIDDSKRASSSASPVPTADQLAAPPVDLRILIKDARLDPSWKPPGEKPFKFKELVKAEAILLTGATGFLGTALLAEILKACPTATIFCIVRPRQTATRASARAADANASLSSILEDRVLSSGLLGPNPEKYLKKSFQKRVTVLEGDLEKPHFGLSDETWQLLSHSIRYIFNTGAYVNSVLPYHRLAPSNVEGTRTCIELASISQRKLLVHVSTSGVLQARSDRSESHLEYDIWKVSNNLLRLGGYNISKYVAELLVWEAIDREFPCIVVRPGFIGAAASTGFANDNDFDNRLLVGLSMLKIAPDSTSPLITFPVDSLCKIVLKMAETPDCNGLAYHLVNNASEFSLQLMVQALKFNGYKLDTIPFAEWKTLIHKMEDESNPIFTMVEEYFSRTYFHTRAAGIPTDRASEFVKTKTKIKIPPTDLEYTNRWIEWLVSHNILKAPANP